MELQWPNTILLTFAHIFVVSLNLANPYLWRFSTRRNEGVAGRDAMLGAACPQGRQFIFKAKFLMSEVKANVGRLAIARMLMRPEGAAGVSSSVMDCVARACIV